MKKIVLFIFVAVFGVMTAIAQEVDSLQSDDLSARVDSLSMQLKQLQHEYDYLYCKYELDIVAKELQILVNDINNSSNTILIYDNHNSFDMDLYRAYKLHYDVSVENFNAIKKKVDALREVVAHKISASNFMVTELNVLRGCNEVIDLAVASAETSLNKYKVSIASYLM